MEALAGAPEDRLLKQWEGLGYYNRARNLRRAAQVIVERYGGQVPASLRSCAPCRGLGTIRPGPLRPSRFRFRFRRWTAMCCG